MIIGHWELRGFGLWAVEERASGAFLGRIGCFEPEGWPGFEIGYTSRATRGARDTRAKQQRRRCTTRARCSVERRDQRDPRRQPWIGERRDKARRVARRYGRFLRRTGGDLSLSCRLASARPTRFSAVTTRQRYLTARFAYVAVVLLATLASLQFSSDLDDASMRLARAFSPSLTWRDAIDGLRNAVLFRGARRRVGHDVAHRQRRARDSAGNARFVRAQRDRRRASGILAGSHRRASSTSRRIRSVDLPARSPRRCYSSPCATAKRDRSYVGIPTLLIAGPYARGRSVRDARAAVRIRSDALRRRQSADASVGRRSRRRCRSIGTRFPSSTFRCSSPRARCCVALVRERRGASSVQWIGISIVGAIAAVVAHVAHGLFGLPVRWEADDHGRAVDRVRSLGG